MCGPRSTFGDFLTFVMISTGRGVEWLFQTAFSEAKPQPKPEPPTVLLREIVRNELALMLPQIADRGRLIEIPVEDDDLLKTNDTTVKAMVVAGSAFLDANPTMKAEDYRVQQAMKSMVASFTKEQCGQAQLILMARYVDRALLPKP